MPTAQVAAKGSPASACQLELNALEKPVAAASKPGVAHLGAGDREQVIKFPLLAGEYKAGTFDYMLSEGAVTTREWLHVFRKSVPAYRRAAAADPAVPEASRPAAVAAFVRAFEGVLDALERDPTLGEVDGFVTAPLSCATLCRVRDQALHRAGFLDIFKPLKDRENDLALELLPTVLQELDAEPDAGKRLELALRGVFAGNIFDMGCAETAARTDSSAGEGGSSGAFAATRAQLLPRPWAVDDLDALLSHFASRPRPHNKAILFVDNAGPDVVLGMVPFARELLKRGTQVVLAANAAPSINDITAPELAPLLARASGADALLARCLAERALRVASSGNDLGVIDLSRVSRDIAAEAEEGCDLVVLEGMGRGIETNLRAAFACDSAKLGMIKHPEVARLLNGRMYDIVCKFDPAPGGTAAR